MWNPGECSFRSALNFGTAIWTQQVGQIAYGLATFSEIAFFAYIYARLEKDQHENYVVHQTLLRIFFLRNLALSRRGFAARCSNGRVS